MWWAVPLLLCTFLVPSSLPIPTGQALLDVLSSFQSGLPDFECCQWFALGGWNPLYLNSWRRLLIVDFDNANTYLFQCVLDLAGFFDHPLQLSFDVSELPGGFVIQYRTPPWCVSSSICTASFQECDLPWVNEWIIVFPLCWCGGGSELKKLMFAVFVQTFLLLKVYQIVDLPTIFAIPLIIFFVLLLKTWNQLQTFYLFTMRWDNERIGHM